MEQLLSNLSTKEFLVIGRAGVDFYPDPPGTKTEDATHFLAHLGGSSANISVALSKQACPTSLLTTLQDDALGRLALKQLQSYKVNTDLIQMTNDDKDARVSLAVVENTVFDHQSIIYRNHAVDLQLTSEQVWSVLGIEPARGAALNALRFAKVHSMTTVIDIDYRPYSWRSATQAAMIYQKAVSLCDIVVGNEAEFAIISVANSDSDFKQCSPKSGISGQSGEKDRIADGCSAAGGVAEVTDEAAIHRGMRFAKRLVENGSSLITIYKMGKTGSVAFIRKQNCTEIENIQCGIFPVQALKPTEAGDAFVGGFLASLRQVNGLTDDQDKLNFPMKLSDSASKQLIKEAIKRGSAAAAIVVSKIGCAPAMPTQDSLEEFISQNEMRSDL